MLLALPHDFLPDAETVIAFFIPFEESVTEGNIENRNCLKEWATAYIETNRLIYDLNRHIRDCLEIRGFDSTIIPATHNFDPESLISDWSHRHIAFIAGLGTLGINNMLITEKGCCGKCTERCVDDALFIDSFYRKRCYSMCLENDRYHSDMDLTDVCGKCLAGLPCSFENPIRSLVKR